MFTAGSEKTYRLTGVHGNGFTLLELIVVMVIMTIVLGVVGPRFVGVVGGDDLARFTKGVAAYLRNARELSVVRNVPVTVEIDDQAGWITCADEHTDVQSLSPMVIPETIQVTMEINRSLREGAIIFYPLGNATESRILLDSDDGNSRTIEIEGVTGEIYIE
jgi:general secretion pathway protein H